MAFTLETLIAGCLQDSFELGERVELVTKGFLQEKASTQPLIFANNLVDGFLRADALVIVVYLLSIGIHPAGNDVQMVVVGIVMGVDK